MSQPQYWIRATARCQTHAPGTVLAYTGPRNGVAHGWRVIGRCYAAQSACDLAGALSVIGRA
jgi:hypothetical protein